MAYGKNGAARGVCLVGFMGAGKTSVGRLLSRRLGWPFTDLDDVIQSQEQRSIAEIFRQAGEAGFRQAETAALHKVLAQLAAGPMVLAVGGGAFVQKDNAGALRQAGLAVVFLDAAPEELQNRCAHDRVERPLFRDPNQFRQLYETRRRRYLEADLLLETGGLTVEEVAFAVARRLGLEEA
jgi:shikimate kinase